MGFKLTIGGEVVKELDVDPALIRAINIGTYRIPVNTAELVERNVRAAASLLEDEYNEQLTNAGVIPEADLVTPEEKELRRSLEDKAQEGQDELDRVESERDSDVPGLVRDDGNSDKDDSSDESDDDNSFEVEEDNNESTYA
jgi:hypothetical protein